MSGKKSLALFLGCLISGCSLNEGSRGSYDSALLFDKVPGKISASSIVRREGVFATKRDLGRHGFYFFDDGDRIYKRFWWRKSSRDRF